MGSAGRNLPAVQDQGTGFDLRAGVAQGYGYTIVPFAEALFVCLFALGIGLLDTTQGWNGLDTASVVVAVLGSAGFFAARYFRREQLLHQCWRVLHGSSS